MPNTDRLSTGPMSLLHTNSDFFRLWLSGVCTGVVRWLEVLAVAVYVYEVTDSAFLVAFMTTLRMLPLALFSAFAGAIGDRSSRRGMLLVGMMFMSLQSVALASLVLTDAIKVWHIGLGTFFSGTFLAIEMPTRRTLMAEFAGRDRVAHAMSFDQITNSATRMLGPVLGGVLLALIGIEGAYLLGAVLFVSASVLTIIMRDADRPTLAVGRNVLVDIVEGLRFVRRSRKMLCTLAITIVFNMWVFPFTAMVPVIGRDVLGLGEFSVGVLVSMEGLGALVGASMVLFFARPAFYWQLYVAGVLFPIFMVLAFSHASWLVLAGMLLFGAGVGIVSFSIMQPTIVILESPPEARVRLLGVTTVCVGVAPLGFLNVGAMANVFGAPVAVAVTALEGLLAMGVVLAIWPKILSRAPFSSSSSLVGSVDAGPDHGKVSRKSRRSNAISD